MTASARAAAVIIIMTMAWARYLDLDLQSDARIEQPTILLHLGARSVCAIAAFDLTD